MAPVVGANTLNPLVRAEEVVEAMHIRQRMCAEAGKNSREPRNSGRCCL